MKLFSFLHPAGKSAARIPDTDLIADCLAGEARAWDVLIERYAPLINTVTIRMGLSPADGADVFQEVCLQMLNHLGDLRDKSRLAGWIIVTTRREAWRLRRQHGPRLLSEMTEGEQYALENFQGLEPQDEMDERLIALEQQHQIRLALECLPERCRTLLTLLYVNDPPASYAEVSEQLNIPAGSIGPTRARCLIHLRKNLEKDSF